MMWLQCCLTFIMKDRLAPVLKTFFLIICLGESLIYILIASLILIALFMAKEVGFCLGRKLISPINKEKPLLSSISMFQTAASLHEGMLRLHLVYDRSFQVKFFIYMWAATWQNQQNGWAPSEDSDQPEHPASLIRVFAVRMKKPWVLSYPLSAQRRLFVGRTVIMLILSCRGSCCFLWSIQTV